MIRFKNNGTRSITTSGKLFYSSKHKLLAYVLNLIFQQSREGCPVNEKEASKPLDRKLAQAALASVSGGGGNGGCPSKHGETYVSECPSSGATAMKKDEIDPLNAVGLFILSAIYN